MKNNLLTSQKKIFHYMKKRALGYEEGHHFELKNYRKNYVRYSNRTFKIASEIELRQKLIKSQFIFVTDFHTFDQHVKNLLRLLNSLLKRKKNIILCLEMLHDEDNYLLESFLERHITEIEFLESINYKESWKFPWTHYRKIFEYAKTYPNLKLRGINCKGTIEKRDQYAARCIVEEWKLQPEKTQFITFYGEYHLAPNKLPKLVFQLLDLLASTTPSKLILHQNLDGPYWKMIEKKKIIGKDTVIKFNEDEFCLLTSPTWMKYESLSYWYENVHEDPEYDLHEFIIENGLKSFGENTLDNFSLLCNQIIVTHELSLKVNELHFTPYDQKNSVFVEKFIKKSFNLTGQKFYLSLLEMRESFVLAGLHRFFCSNYSINKLCKLAGEFLYQTYWFSKNKNTEIFQWPKGKETFFCFFVMSNFCAYFFAKGINPYLKCNLYLDIKDLVNTNDAKKNNAKEMLNNIRLLSMLDHPNNLSTILSKVNLHSTFQLAKSLGEIMAESYIHLIFSSEIQYKGKDFESNIIYTPLHYENIAKLMNDVMPIPWFKLQRKRYF